MPVSIANQTTKSTPHRRHGPGGGDPPLGVARLGRAAGPSGSAELPELAVDLGVHVERLLALSHTALVAGDDELADLFAETLVGGRRARGLGELGDLGVHVEGRLAARDAARRLRLHELADLLVGLGLGGGGAGVGPWAALLLVAVHRQPAAPDPLVQAAAGDRRHHGYHDR